MFLAMSAHSSHAWKKLWLFAAVVSLVAVPLFLQGCGSSSSSVTVQCPEADGCQITMSCDAVQVTTDVSGCKDAKLNVNHQRAVPKDKDCQKAMAEVKALEPEVLCKKVFNPQEQMAEAQKILADTLAASGALGAPSAKGVLKPAGALVQTHTTFVKVGRIKVSVDENGELSHAANTEMGQEIKQHEVKQHEGKHSIHDPIEYFSQSNQKWCPGEVSEVGDNYVEVVAECTGSTFGVVERRRKRIRFGHESKVCGVGFASCQHDISITKFCSTEGGRKCSSNGGGGDTFLISAEKVRKLFEELANGEESVAGQDLLVNLSDTLLQKIADAAGRAGDYPGARKYLITRDLGIESHPHRLIELTKFRAAMRKYAIGGK